MKAVLQAIVVALILLIAVHACEPKTDPDSPYSTEQDR